MLPLPRARRTALALAGLLAIARMIQLAIAPAENSSAPWGEARSVVSAALANQPAVASGELAQLYALCPMAAVVDLETVAASHEEEVHMVPPYRAVAERVRTLFPYTTLFRSRKSVV